MKTMVNLASRAIPRGSGVIIPGSKSDGTIPV